jgi:MFS family permease
MNTNITQHRILWRQVWGLSALVAAIVFSWMAYGYYQPVILINLGFAQMAASLGIVQGFLGAAIEPWIGATSDRLLDRMGSRLPVIAGGITLAGLLFVTLGLLLHSDLPAGVRWTIPVLMTFWVIAMIVIRGPAIALLRQFAPTEALPAANSILTLVFGLVGALNPIFGRLINFLGAGNTFLFGAVTLILGTVLMWSTHPGSARKIAAPAPIFTPTTAEAEIIQWLQRKQKRSLSPHRLQIFGMGLVMGLFINILLRLSPQRLHETLTGIPAEYITVGILLISAITILPLQKQIEVWGLNKSMAIGLMAISIVIGTIAVFAHPVVSILAIGMAGTAMGLISIAQIPWCLAMLPPQQAGLATGLYFGGISGATALLSLILIKP